jgi:hypothetical protein
VEVRYYIPKTEYRGQEGKVFMKLTWAALRINKTVITSQRYALPSIIRP